MFRWYDQLLSNRGYCETLPPRIPCRRIVYIPNMCSIWSHQYISNISLVQSQIINESTLSTGKVVAHLTLNKGDRKILAFRKEVDKVMLKVINNVYGNFSYYTVPIFTQGCLSRLANYFKNTLGIQYEESNIMLNKYEKQVYKSQTESLPMG